MHLVTFLEFLQQSEFTLGDSYRVVSEGHRADDDVQYATRQFASECTAHAEALAPVLAGAKPGAGPDRLHAAGLTAARPGPLGLLRDLQDLYQLASLVDITWMLVRQAAQGARERELLSVVDRCAPQTTAQLAWLRMRMKAAAPQTLLVAS